MALMATVSSSSSVLASNDSVRQKSEICNQKQIVIKNATMSNVDFRCRLKEKTLRNETRPFSMKLVDKWGL